jgi:hypothetical protein
LRKFDAYDKAKFKVDIEMSKEYIQEKIKKDLVREIESWFSNLPKGTYTFKGRWWRQYFVDTGNPPNTAGIWRWEDRSDMCYLEYDDYKNVKWIIDNRYKVVKGTKFLHE